MKQDDLEEKVSFPNQTIYLKENDNFKDYKKREKIGLRVHIIF